MTAPETTAVATTNGAEKKLNPADKLREKLSRLVPMMTEITGDKQYGQRALHLLILCANGNPDLHLCTEASLAASMLKVAQWGLDIGETAHIVPFNVNTAPKGQPKKWEKRAQAIPDYRGLMQLATDRFTGSVREFLPPRVVRAGDDFEYSYGLEETLHHIPAEAAKRGAITGAYVVAVKSMNVRTFAYMSITEIEAIRARSKSWGPDTVADCPEWYALKTVVRNFCSKLPKKGRKLMEAMAEDPEIPDADYSEVERQRAIGAPVETDLSHMDEEREEVEAA